MVKAASESGGVLQIHANNINGPIIAEITIPKGNDWKVTKAPIIKLQAGVQNLFIVSKDNNQVEVDWIKFE